MEKNQNDAVQGNTSQIPDIDYSEIYRTQELKQLNKRLRKTRNILLLCAAIITGGALIFWSMTNSSFKTSDFLLYSSLAFILIILSFFASKRPYFCILFALVLCIFFWAAEIIIKNSDDLLIEGAIQKLTVISLLVTSLHASKEAELIRKELHFS